MKFMAGVLATLVVMVVIGGVIMFSGAYNVAASAGHSDAGNWLLHTAMHYSVKARTDGITEPSDLADEDRVERGAGPYDQMCAACHLKPGQDTTLVHSGLTPTPPRLDRSGHWSAPEQFWIVRHGIKMTGMPAWGGSHSDEELWDIVAFLQRLPELSESEYAELVAPARNGEQDDGHDHDHGDMQAMGDDGHHEEDEEPEPEASEGDDDHYSDGHTH